MKSSGTDFVFGKAFKIFTYISLLVISFSTILIGVFQPDVSDDFVFSRAVETFSLPGYLDHWYFGWTGRMPGVILLRFALWNDLTKVIFGALNGILLIICIYISMCIALQRVPKLKSIDLPVVLFSAAALWFGLPVIGETVFWRTGAAVYLWSMFFALVFLVPYCFSANEKPEEMLGTGKFQNILFTTAMFLLGLLTGNSQEQIFTSAAAAAILWMVCCIIRKRSFSIKPWLYSGLAGLIAGGIALAAAPGNFIRVDQLGAEPGILYKLFSFLIYILRVFVINPSEKLYVWMALLLLLYILSYRSRTIKGHLDVENNSENEIFPSNTASHTVYGFSKLAGFVRSGNSRINTCIFIISAFASLAPMFLFPSCAADRTGFFAIFYIVMAAASVFERIKAPKWFTAGMYKDAVKAVLAITLIVLLCDTVYGASAACLFHQEASARHLSIIEQKKSGVENVEVRPFRTLQRRTTYIMDLSPDPDNWVNNAVKDYYQVKSIRQVN